jgi:hypothetical protein
MFARHMPPSRGHFGAGLVSADEGLVWDGTGLLNIAKGKSHVVLSNLPARSRLFDFGRNHSAESSNSNDSYITAQTQGGTGGAFDSEQRLPSYQEDQEDPQEDPVFTPDPA